MNNARQNAGRQAVAGLSCGICAMGLLFASFCATYICLLGKAPAIIWFGFVAGLVCLTCCVVIYWRCEAANPLFARALLAGACLAALAVFLAVCVVDNLVGFSA